MSNTSEIRHIPQQVRSAARRTQLLDVARELVREDGIDALTTGAIAVRAGASIGTVYRYWSDVHAILDEILPGRRQAHDVLLDRAALDLTDRTVSNLLLESAYFLTGPGRDRADIVRHIALSLAALEVHDRENGTVPR